MPAFPGPDFAGSPRYAAFRDLGEGTVNIPESVQTLRTEICDGLIITELDRTPGLSARVSRDYLRQVLGG